MPNDNRSVSSLEDAQAAARAAADPYQRKLENYVNLDRGLTSEESRHYGELCEKTSTARREALERYGFKPEPDKLIDTPEKLRDEIDRRLYVAERAQRVYGKGNETDDARAILSWALNVAADLGVDLPPAEPDPLCRLAMLKAACRETADDDSRAKVNGGTAAAQGGGRLSLKELAQRHNLNDAQTEALRGLFYRWRPSHCNGEWIEIDPSYRRPNTPKYLYDPDAVLPIIGDLKKRSTRASVERPPAEN